MRSFALPLIVVLAAVGLSAVDIVKELDARAQKQNESAGKGTPVTTACAVPDGAQLVPDQGALFGVNLDLDSKALGEYARDLGRGPAVSVSFTGFPYTAQEKTDLQRAVSQIRVDGQMMLLTLEPMKGLDAVTSEAAEALAEDLAAFNADGVPVIVRFAHEMNGSWYPWSQQPARYITAFQTVAAAVHAHAPGSAMMWAPNYGGGYPFAGGRFEAEPGSVDFTALDTDADGALTLSDDPYAPYYPGDTAVDWVGMSLYHWGSAHPWGENELPEAGKFADQLTGNYSGANGDESRLPDFYQVYGGRHGKPIAIPETAAFFAPATGGETELAIKQAWWEQLFSPETAAQFPQVKMINWFEWDKNETEVGGRVNWTVTDTPQVREAFTAALPDWIHFASSGACASRSS
ncbi:glycoside hydrolase family 26 protein [Arthrobacter crusticola]|uniref:glycoside hydrolase family 26 protein n=1 Tax=Arthrobacter crusticola TaxID=2547960 RepID=UPI001FECE79A|nr:glycosyl hydrolase [Arthrobacter crusticola]